ncbi:hypothetical protein D9611_013460 [Ephemerocybe angulata]|uniref:BZIP domain-containing protein n=1 Tax=Ephemerocybe angulata TaxID=980116 RepID=A0A8H5FAA7_9AGAR|nr:hypothetical protein D9611_013460 [Tulosesus angulatus]
MPKSKSNQGATEESNGGEAHVSKVALRKKKNADAQASFRARRANYVATLEETVTNLESVVLQLQESYRELHVETQKWKLQYSSVHFEFWEREKAFRALWQSKKMGQFDELSLPQSPNSSALLQSNAVSLDVDLPHSHVLQLSSTHLGCESFDNSEHFSPAISTSIPLSTEPDSLNLLLGGPVYQVPVYGQYSNCVAAVASPRDPVEPIQDRHGRGAMPKPNATHQPSQPPVHLESPSSIASQTSYPGQLEGETFSVHSVPDGAPFSFPNEMSTYQGSDATNAVGSRSISPLPLPASSSSTTAASINFTPYSAHSTNEANDCQGYGCCPRCPSLPHVSLHGGTTNISSLSLVEVSARRTASGQQQHSTPRIVSISTNRPSPKTGYPIFNVAAPLSLRYIPYKHGCDN